MKKIPHTIVELDSFLESTDDLWTNEEREEFKTYIGLNLLAGDIIPGTGGIRKVRWARAGTGKRGGVRVIYYYYNETTPLFLLLAYAKGVQDNLTNDDKNDMRNFVEDLKKQFRQRRLH